jgi:hypothetical protein
VPRLEAGVMFRAVAYYIGLLMFIVGMNVVISHIIPGDAAIWPMVLFSLGFGLISPGPPT